MVSQKEKCDQFEALHQGDEAFLIPNPWDTGSASILEGLGFKALATTSSGLAYTLGRSDGEVSLDEKLLHCEALAKATTVPINADFENGFALDADTVAKNILRLAETGVAGCSIEDFDREAHVLYDFNESLERVQAASEAVASLDMAFQLTARAENLLRGVDDIDDTIKRLQAFEAAGAHVLYAPGINSIEQLQQVCAELKKPFNVLAPFIGKASVSELSAAGARRVSIGGALTYASINPIISAGKEMMESGTFNWLSGMASGAEIQSLMKK